MPLFLEPVDMARNELQNARLQSLATAPATPPAGFIYFDSALGKFGVYDGTAWEYYATVAEALAGIAVAAPITITGTGDTRTIGIPAATPTAAGYLTGADKGKIDGVEAGATKNSTDAALRDRTTHTGEQPIATVTGLQAALDAKIALAEKAAANGVASLDAGGKIPAGQLPALAITERFVAADQTAMLALAAQIGDIASRTDTGTLWQLVDTDPTLLASWRELVDRQGVTDVLGGTGITSSGGTTPTIALASLGIATGHLGDLQVTEAKLAQAVQDKLNAAAGALKHAATIGDGVATSFTVTHNFNTRDVDVAVYQAATPFQKVYPGIAATTLAAVTVSFSAAPATGQYRVVVVG